MRSWLLVVWALVLAMVLVGGITRLTGSGLSITEWKPVTGALPPLDEASWQAEFDLYRASPQFKQVNHWMQLADFKRIYFWEYVHRLLGRAIGFVVLLPFLYFLARRRIERGLSWRIAGVLALGGLQGALGWFMVKSGLVNEPQVSHFRLAAHLLLAFLVGQLVLWLALGIGTPASEARALPATRGRIAAVGFIALVALQSMYGAFMAGTRAGYYFGSFPDMDGSFGPGRFFTGASAVQDALSNPLAIHWLHRTLGWAVLIAAFALAAWLLRAELRTRVRAAAYWVAALAFFQLNLGAITVISRVSLSWAVAHQGMAYLLLSAATLLLHRMLRTC